MALWIGKVVDPWSRRRQRDVEKEQLLYLSITCCPKKCRCNAASKTGIKRGRYDSVSTWLNGHLWEQVLLIHLHVRIAGLVSKRFGRVNDIRAALPCLMLFSHSALLCDPLPWLILHCLHDSFPSCSFLSFTLWAFYMSVVFVQSLVVDSFITRNVSESSVSNLKDKRRQSTLTF